MSHNEDEKTIRLAPTPIGVGIIIRANRWQADVARKIHEGFRVPARLLRRKDEGNIDVD